MFFDERKEQWSLTENAATSHRFLFDFRKVIECNETTTVQKCSLPPPIVFCSEDLHPRHSSNETFLNSFKALIRGIIHVGVILCVKKYFLHPVHDLYQPTQPANLGFSNTIL